MQLDDQNEWIKSANRLPWKAWEASYASLFPGIKGNVAKPCPMVLGSLIIQQRMGFSDRELVKQIQENPYYQYFIGLEAFQHTPPFAATLLVEWRKRINADFVIKVNDALCDAMPRNQKTKKIFGASGKVTPVATQIEVIIIHAASGDLQPNRLYFFVVLHRSKIRKRGESQFHCRDQRLGGDGWIDVPAVKKEKEAVNIWSNQFIFFHINHSSLNHILIHIRFVRHAGIILFKAQQGVMRILFAGGNLLIQRVKMPIVHHIFHKSL